MYRNKHTNYKLLLRYNKYLLKSTSKIFFFWLVKVLLKFFYIICSPFLRASYTKECDILVVGTCDVDINNSIGVWNKLIQSGFSVKQIVLKAYTKYHFNKLGDLSFDITTPASLFFEQLYSKYIVKKYNPKIICSFISSGVIPSLLKSEMKGKGFTIFISHAIIPITDNYTSLDYDYYLIFGQSSLVNLQKLPLRIGSPKIILSGSPMISKNYSLKPINVPIKTLLYFSTWGIETFEERFEVLRKSFDVIIKWAIKHPEYNLLIKLHPLENGKYVYEHTSKIKNITILDKDTSMIDALKNVSIVITTFSVASIEAAMMNRPIIVCNYDLLDKRSADSYKSDAFLHLEKFFPPRARNVEDLHDRITTVEKNYKYYVSQCQKYAKYHLGHTTDSQEHISEIISAIYSGKENFKYIKLTEKVDLINA